MTEWVHGSGKSPDRVDALVWALSTLDLNSYAAWDESLSKGSSFASSIDEEEGGDIWSQMGYVSNGRDPYSGMGF